MEANLITEQNFKRSKYSERVLSLYPLICSHWCIYVYFIFEYPGIWDVRNHWLTEIKQWIYDWTSDTVNGVNDSKYKAQVITLQNNTNPKMSFNASLGYLETKFNKEKTNSTIINTGKTVFDKNLGDVCVSYFKSDFPIMINWVLENLSKEEISANLENMMSPYLSIISEMKLTSKEIIEIHRFHKILNESYKLF